MKQHNTFFVFLYIYIFLISWYPLKITTATTAPSKLKTTLSNAVTKVKSLSPFSQSKSPTQLNMAISDDEVSLSDTDDDQNETTATSTTPTTTPKSATTPSFPINQNLQKVLSALESIPAKYKPADMQKSLTSILQGGNIWKAIQSHSLYTALSIPTTNPATTKTLQLVFDSSDDAFWQQAHKSQAFQEEIARSNIPFTKQSCSSKEYKMLFRMAYLRTTITDPVMYKTIVNAYQQSIIKLQWYLFAQTIVQENKAFTSGMITQPDEDLSLFLFLDGYSELVSPRYRLYSALSPHSLWQSQAYSRKSSHWPNKKEFNDTNFGIDFKDVDGNSMPDLPGNKSHLLFGTLDNGHTFIKWEEYGITINFKESDYSAFTHVVRYFEKKDKQDTNLHRREVVPKDVEFNFKSYSSTVTPTEKTAMKKDGISAMLSNLQSEPEKHEAFTNYLTNVKQYPADTLHVRKGNEVILQPHRFVPLTQPTTHTSTTTVDAADL